MPRSISNRLKTHRQPSLNGYIVFCHYYREICKEEFPDLTPQQRFSKFGQVWKQLPIDLKNSFTRFAETEKLLRQLRQQLHIIFDNRCAEAAEQQSDESD